MVCFICGHLACFAEGASEAKHVQACRFQGQANSHAEVLGRFERDLRLLSSVNILPAAQTQQYKCLADLVPEEQYCDWAAKCSAAHENLVRKVC